MCKILIACMISALLAAGAAESDTFFRTYDFGNGEGWFYGALELPGGNIALLRGWSQEEPPMIEGNLLVDAQGDSIHFYQGYTQASYCIDADSSIVRAWEYGYPAEEWKLYWENIYCDSLHSADLAPPAGESEFSDICNAEDGGYLLCGGSPYGCGGAVRIDSLGAPVWTRVDSTVGYKCAAWDGSGSYLLGGNHTGSSSLSYQKVSDDGDLLWEWTSSGQWVHPTQTAVSTPDGGFAAGVFSDSYADNAILRLSAGGDSMWVYDSAIEDIIWSEIIVCGSDLLAVGFQGSDQGSLSVLARLGSDGTLIWEREYPDCALYCVNAAIEGGFILTGAYPHPFEYDNQSLVIKTDSEG